jgi:hypothetical protein
MQPVYVRKSNPNDRITWMDKFIAQEPKGGVRDVVEMARAGRVPTTSSAIFALIATPKQVAA